MSANGMVVSRLRDAHPKFRTEPVQVRCSFCDMSMWANSDSAFVIREQTARIICRSCAEDNEAQVTVGTYLTTLFGNTDEGMTAEEYATAMRAEGYHQCPDGIWRRTPSNGMFDGLCGVCETYANGDDGGYDGFGRTDDYNIFEENQIMLDQSIGEYDND